MCVYMCWVYVPPHVQFNSILYLNVQHCTCNYSTVLELYLYCTQLYLLYDLINLRHYIFPNKSDSSSNESNTKFSRV